MRLSIVACVCFLPLGTIASEPNQRLADMIGNYQYLRADFSQVTLGRINRKKTQTGSLFIAKPQKLRLQIDAPQKQLVVVDGNFIWHTRFALKQTVKKTLQTSNAAFGLLASSNDKVSAIIDKFSVTILADEECMTQIGLQKNYTKTTCFLVKSSGNNDQQDTVMSLLLYFVYAPLKNAERESWQIHAMRIENRLGSVTNITFKLPLDYARLESDLFIFVPDSSFELVGDGGL